MSERGVSRRLVLWAAFVAFCTVAMAYLPFADAKVAVIGHITYYEVLLAAAGLLGGLTLLRVAGASAPSGARTACRIVIAYLLYEVLVVVPVAIWLGTASLNTIIGAVAVRFTWLLFPVMLTLCGDDRARRTAGAIAVAGAVCLAVWGVYLAATGGGGYYLDSGEWRYRILYGGASLLFAWPFVLAVSKAAPRRYTLALLGVGLIGLTLTNHRSGLIAFAVAAFACVAMSGQIRRLVPWILPVALIAVAADLVLAKQASGVFGYNVSHLFDVSSGNGADRLMRWRLAWEFFTTRPFNDYVWSWRYYLVHLQDPYQPHNFALEIAVTEGVAGLVFYGSMLTMALRKAWKWGRADSEARALIGFLIAYLVFVAANANWYLPVNIALLIAAVAALIARVDRLETEAVACAPEGSPEQ